MLGRLLLPAILVLSLQAQSTGPSYSASGIVNGASFVPGPLAPNTWMTLYGTNLSFNTATATMTDGQWPIEIPGTGVRILFSGGTPAHISFVSPTQINFLTPASRLPGPTTLVVVRNGIAGPSIATSFADVSPGLFTNNTLASAAHADGSSITADAPAQPGESIMLYATGLGPSAVPLDSQSDGRIVTSTDLTALRLERYSDLNVTFDGTALDPARISWAGLAQNFAGMYQINLQLPDDVGPNPAVRVWIGDQGSADNVHLAVQPPPPPPPPPTDPPPTDPAPTDPQA